MRSRFIAENAIDWTGPQVVSAVLGGSPRPACSRNPDGKACESIVAQQEMSLEGTILLFGQKQYDRTLALARAGILPFFVLACAMVFLWGRRILGPAGAVVAVFLFTMIPTVLAHSGLATTDIGLTATFASAAYTLVVLVQRPAVTTAALFGLAFALMVLSKFSALVFCPAAAFCAALWYVWRRRSQRSGIARALLAVLKVMPISAAIAFLIAWAGYRFSWGVSPWFSFPVPFPELFSGIEQVRTHNAQGHLSYFLGESGTRGWLTFFPCCWL